MAMAKRATTHVVSHPPLHTRGRTGNKTWNFWTSLCRHLAAIPTSLVHTIVPCVSVHMHAHPCVRMSVDTERARASGGWKRWRREKLKQAPRSARNRGA